MPLTVTPQEKEELLVTYAALILHDDKAPITADNISKLIAAAGGNVQPYWPKLFENLLKGKDVTQLLLTSGGGGGGGGGPAAPASGGEEKEEKKGGGDKKGKGKEKEKEPEKEKEESEGDMGFSLFD